MAFFKTEGMVSECIAYVSKRRFYCLGCYLNLCNLSYNIPIAFTDQPGEN